MWLTVQRVDLEGVRLGAITDKEWWRRHGLVVAVAVLAMVPLMFPGDAPFINDEAMLIHNALLHNAEGSLATRGLMGTMGVHYGPLPTLFYQAMLTMTDNLVVIVFVKYLLAVTLLLTAMLWMSSICKLPRAFACLIALSPYVLLFHRSLWDDGFMIPLAAWLLLAYAQFLKTERGGWLALAAAICVVLVYTQFKMVFVIVGASCVCVGFSWRALWRRRWLTLGTLGVGALACFPYLLYVVFNMRSSDALHASRWEALISSFTIVRGLSFAGWAEAYVPSMNSALYPLPGVLRTVLVAVTISVAGLALVGLVASVAVVRKGQRETRLRRYCSVTAWSILGLQLLFVLFASRTMLPHYFSAVWIAWFYLVLEGVLWVLQHRWGKAWAGAYAGAMAVLWVTTLLHIHQVGGARTHTYGALLSDQLAIAREIVDHPTEQPLGVRVRNYQLFPHTLHLLMRMDWEGRSAPPSPHPTRRLLVTYRDPPDAQTGWLRLLITDDPADGQPAPPPSDE